MIKQLKIVNMVYDVSYPRFGNYDDRAGLDHGILSKAADLLTTEFLYPCISVQQH